MHTSLTACVVLLSCLFVSTQYSASSGSGISYNNNHFNMHYDWYPLDGGNNLKHPNWGTYGDAQIWDHPTMKYEPEFYGPNPRTVSNIVSAAYKGWTALSPRNTSSYLTVWGQFVNHDVEWTPQSKETWNIYVPKCDYWFDPGCEGNVEIGFYRTEPVQQKHKINFNTCWIDGSQIYGSTYDVSHALRAFHGGLLKTSHAINPDDGEFPPFVYELDSYDSQYIQMGNDAHVYPTDYLFACGDVRCNENPLLLSLHVLFLREHNRVARYLGHLHPNWNDDQIFECARKYVIATLQHITFYEYLYWLLGRPFPEPDLDYDEEIDPRIHLFFSTVAFRYGHSEVGDLLQNAIDGQYGHFPQWQYSKLWNHFFDPYYLLNSGITGIWEGMAYQIQQSPDEKLADSVRNHLFQGYSKYPKYDLMALDIQRSRDHGLPRCNDARIAYGLHAINKWEDFDVIDKLNGANPTQVLGELEAVYPNPWVADSFICGIAEKWVDSKYASLREDYSNLGKLFEAAIISQFQRLRIGDRFWFSRNLDEVHSYGDLPDLRHRTLADVIRENSVEPIHIPDYVFKVDW